MLSHVSSFREHPTTAKLIGQLQRFSLIVFVLLLLLWLGGGGQTNVGIALHLIFLTSLHCWAMPGSSGWQIVHQGMHCLLQHPTVPRTSDWMMSWAIPAAECGAFLAVCVDWLCMAE